MSAFAAVILSLVSSSANAIYVKRIGHLEIRDYNCVMTPDSSFIGYICRHAKGGQPNVIAELGPTVYGWCYMPHSVVVEWMTAYSKGHFFNKYIKGRYGC